MASVARFLKEFIQRSPSEEERSERRYEAVSSTSPSCSSSAYRLKPMMRVVWENDTSKMMTNMISKLWYDLSSRFPLHFLYTFYRLQEKSWVPRRTRICSLPNWLDGCVGFIFLLWNIIFFLLAFVQVRENLDDDEYNVDDAVLQRTSKKQSESRLEERDRSLAILGRSDSDLAPVWQLIFVMLKLWACDNQLRHLCHHLKILESIYIK
jgi:hypothetical protein